MQYFIPHKNALVELTVEHMEVCSILCGSLDRREVWGRMDTGIFMAKPLYTLPEITRILLLLSSLSFFFFFYRFIYFFFTELHLLAVQGMLPVRGSWGKSVLGFSLGWFPWVWSRGLEQWLCSCDTWASVLQGLRDLLGPGIKSLSLAWEGRFLTTRPAGKTYHRIIMGYITIQIKTV